MSIPEEDMDDQEPSNTQQSSAKHTSQNITLLPDSIQQHDIKIVVEFMVFLLIIRPGLIDEIWQHSITNAPQFASWRRFLASDPYTRWGLIEPKEYSDYASIMDFTDGHKSVSKLIEQAGDLGSKIYEITSKAQPIIALFGYCRSGHTLRHARLRKYSAQGV